MDTNIQVLSIHDIFRDMDWNQHYILSTKQGT